MGKPHALVIPYPAQGHVIPLLELSHRLVERGFDITFVNTEFNHDQVVAAFSDTNRNHPIQLVSIPDGIPLGEDRKGIVILTEEIWDAMPSYLEELIRKINGFGDRNDITCIIADETMGWALEVAEKMGIQRVVFWPQAAGPLAVVRHIPKLIEAGIIDDRGFPTESQMIQLSQTTAAINTDHFVWYCMDNPTTQQGVFEFMFKNSQAIKATDWILCNSFYELEPSAFALVPKLLPVGPLLLDHCLDQPAGSFWPEDSTCLGWLDQQPARSVIYVAFGSSKVINQNQFHELAIGLELLGRPFLWVVRSDLTDLTDGKAAPYPDGFQNRVAGRGMIVGWSPQQKVLAHPSVACFFSHCGWNSTMEAVSMGVPLLSWPYFADQFFNQNYISDVWKIGLRLNLNENGMISRDEIKNRVEELLGDEGIRERALELKEMARKSISNGGSSLKNLNDFVERMKQ